ncbi:hypothetical protein ACFQ88_31420 [Paenibacillus sp. NPDC056579]|uniref:hypothetical protein n=1 Tax=Paenibacillus sp. NPDC056579 TaxID=3345871 RepID=UPI0036CA3F73
MQDKRKAPDNVRCQDEKSAASGDIYTYDDNFPTEAGFVEKSKAITNIQWGMPFPTSLSKRSDRRSVISRNDAAFEV